MRVRLQSQSSPTPFPSAATRNVLPPPTAFANLPPTIGISQCCREVFWVSNNSAYCYASPTPDLALASAPASSSLSQAECAAEEASRKTFTSTWDGIRKIARNEGPTTLWRGLTPTLVMAVPANVIYFAGYDWLRFNPSSPIRRIANDNYAPLVAGSVARVLAAIAVSPIEMFRTRMQAAHTATTSAGHFRETMSGMGAMVQSEGYSSLWRGLTLTLWRDVPFSAIYWWGYESGRNVLSDLRERRRGRDPISGANKDAYRMRRRSRSRENYNATLVDSFVAGAASGAVAALVTTPFDVGKTRQQVIKYGSSGEAMIAAAAADMAKRPEELPMPRFLWHIFKEQGMSGLFKGWAARCLKVAPACAIMISSYEIGKKMAGGMSVGELSKEEGVDVMD